MKTSWHFYAVRARTPFGFVWHWQKKGARTPETSAAFNFYFDCVADARVSGYAGNLPLVPKIPLDCLPGALGSEAMSKAAAPAAPGEAEAAQLAMSVTSLASRAKKQRSSSMTAAA